jgi:hypothetical protein
MMFRDPSGLGIVEEIVDGCELVVRAIHEWLFGSDANPLEYFFYGYYQLKE